MTLGPRSAPTTVSGASGGGSGGSAARLSDLGEKLLGEDTHVAEVTSAVVSVHGWSARRVPIPIPRLGRPR